MKNPELNFPSTRREFLRQSFGGAGLLAFSRFAPAFLVQSTLGAAPAPEKDRTILVLVQLAGGNDGLNTLVPYEDANYHRLRPTLALKSSDLLPLGNGQSLHRACAPLQRLLADGQLAIVQNVGYPNPNRSHFRSTDIWQTATDSDDIETEGWIGRYLDNACSGSPTASDPLAVHLGNEMPQAFLGQASHPTFGLSANQRPRGDRRRDRALLQELAHAQPAPQESNAHFLSQTMLDALVTESRVQQVLSEYRPISAYPASAFAQSLKQVAALVSAGLPTRVYFVSLGGFDTHANQLGVHENLLKTLSEGLSAFQSDLKAHRLDEQVLTMTFSEFGRRPAENESRGTDHGTAAPLFVMGSKLRGGLHGTSPSLEVQARQDLTFSTDFRQVYATVLDRWLGCPSEKVLARHFEPVPFL